jgi:hypothetical protein
MLDLSETIGASLQDRTKRVQFFLEQDRNGAEPRDVWNLGFTSN